MILKVFSNPDVSMILWFYAQFRKPVRGTCLQHTVLMSWWRSLSWLKLWKETRRGRGITLFIFQCTWVPSSNPWVFQSLAIFSTPLFLPLFVPASHWHKYPCVGCKMWLEYYGLVRARPFSLNKNEAQPANVFCFSTPAVHIWYSKLNYEDHYLMHLCPITVNGIHTLCERLQVP